MAGNVSLNTVTDGLVLYLDAANTKSLADVPSTNLIKNSQQLQFWNQYQSSVSANTTTAPDGTTTADTNIETSGLTGNRGVQQQLTGMTSGQTYTFSIYAKNFNGRNIELAVYEYPTYTNWYRSNFYLQSGTTSTISINSGSGFRTNTSMVNVGDGWYRCSVSGYITGATQLQPNINFINSANTTSYTGDGVSGVYLWGGQLEVGPVATTYIPTTSTSASRVPTWVDMTGNGNNGTLVNNLTYNYSNGGSLVFDGVTNYTTSPSLSGTSFPQNTGTISFWYNMDSNAPASTGLPIFDGYDNTRNHIFIRRYYISPYNLQVSCVSTTNGGTYVFVTNQIVSLGVWHNIVVTYVTGTNSSVKLYVDGILLNSGTISDSTWKPTGQFVGFGFPLYAAFKGNGSVLQIYNRVLSLSEVQQNYNAVKGRFGLGENTDGLILYLDASNPKSYVSGSTTWYDLSKSQNHYTLVNNPTFSNNGIVFDGINQYAIGPSFYFDQNTSFTIEMFYVKLSPVLGLKQEILAGMNQSGFPDASGNSRVIFGFYGTISGTPYNGRVNVYDYTAQIDNWIDDVVYDDSNNHQLAMIIDKTNKFVKSYSDGGNIIKQVGKDYPSNWTFGPQPIYLACRQAVDNLPRFNINAKIYSFRVYNRVLSDEELLQNYNAAKLKFGL